MYPGSVGREYLACCSSETYVVKLGIPEQDTDGSSKLDQILRVFENQDTGRKFGVYTPN
jgi:hypothetical protein